MSVGPHRGIVSYVTLISDQEVSRAFFLDDRRPGLGTTQVDASRADLYYLKRRPRD